MEAVIIFGLIVFAAMQLLTIYGVVKWIQNRKI